jgi:hypothetical protein
MGHGILGSSHGEGKGRVSEIILVNISSQI